MIETNMKQPGRGSAASPAMPMIFALLVAVFLTAVNAEAINVEKGRLYVVGMGPAGPDLTAPRALSVVSKADVYLCSPGLPARFEWFSEYIDPEKVAFDPWEPFMGSHARQLKQQDYEAWQVHTEKHRKKIQDFVLEQIENGKTVVMMDGGDPIMYAPSLHHLLKGFDDDLFEVIPGMGSFNAAGAALKTTFTPDGVRFVMLTSPRSLFGENWEKDDDILKDLSKYETTMVWYMSLRSIDKVVSRMRNHYSPDFPIAVVYYAGYPDREKVLKSSLGKILEDVRKMEESWLGLFIAGEAAR